MISTNASTLLARHARRQGASMIGELLDVRYSVCLMASTFGSAAACAWERLNGGRERILTGDAGTSLT